MLPITYIGDLQVKSAREEIDLDFFNRRYLGIYNALKGLDDRQGVFDGEVNTFVATALAQLNTQLAPMLTQLQNASTLGFLWAKAIGNPESLVLGEAEGFRVTENAGLFTPTPVLYVQDMTDSSNWGLCTLDAGGWTPSTGDLALHTVYTKKTQASSQWFFSDSAAIFPAMLDLLAQVNTTKAAVDADMVQVAANVATMNALAAAVAAGPVASVAGKTGVVTLVEADIAGLVSDLAGKATNSSVTALLAGKQDASAKLATLAAMTWAANQLLMATSTSALAALPISLFMQGLLANADAPTARTTLGLGDASTHPASDFAPIASPALTGNPTAPTQVATDNSTRIATTAYVQNSVMAVNTQAGTAYTLAITDTGDVVRFTGSAAATLTLPNNMPVGFNCLVEQDGTGVVTMSAAAGATLNSRGGRTKTNGQYASASLWVTANATGTAAIYNLAGDIST